MHSSGLRQLICLSVGCRSSPRCRTELFGVFSLAVATSGYIWLHLETRCVQVCCSGCCCADGRLQLLLLDVNLNAILSFTAVGCKNAYTLLHGAVQHSTVTLLLCAQDSQAIGELGPFPLRSNLFSRGSQTNMALFTFIARLPGSTIF